MDNNNYFHFNYNYYETHLSPFGKKVLQVLIQQWHKDRNRVTNVSIHQNIVQKKRILQFAESNINRSSVNQFNLGNELNTNNLFNNDITSNPVEETIKSTELLKTIEMNDIEIDNCSREDLILPVNNKDKIEVEVCSLYNDERKKHILNINEGKNNKNENITKTNTISWNDMFNTEMLFSEEQNFEELINDEDKPFNDSRSNISNIISSRLDVYEDVDLSNKQNNKRNKQTKTLNKVPKKIKKIKEDCNVILRKQKYTRAVKQWLNDVTPNNSIDEGMNAENETNVQNTNINKIVIESTTDSAKHKPTKKVVQAQLANKNGVMKFSKPKDALNNDTEKVIEDGNKMNKDKIKDRKSKAKFVAPIKSQIPVKDVTYVIHNINDNNIEECNKKIVRAADQEAVAVLIYSNSFNQLNRHYTDDFCEAEGLMMNVDSEFYYFKGVLESSREIFASISNYKVICYQGKDVINYLTSVININDVPDCIIDAKIGSSLLEPDNPPENFSEVQKVLSFKPQYTVATECSLQKAAWYITLLKECVAKMTDLLIQNSLWNVFVNIEMRLLPVVAAMEQRGVTVDLQKLKSMEELLTKKIKSVEQSCYKLAGRSFQINSPSQISAILYDELQLDTKCNVKIRETLCKGAKSTSEAMLRSLVSEHPLPRLILEYRHLHKAHATFITGIAQHVKDDVVKPTWVQTAASTGRIASNNPNLQAIPKAPFSLVMFPGDGEEDGAVLKFRSVYCPRRAHCLVAADFRHVECRVLAHAAADGALLHALADNHDLFQLLAAKWLQKPVEEVSSEDRERTKRIIYASLYGAGTRKLMDILNISYDQTLAIVASFNRTFPSLKSFGRSVVSRCGQNGGRLSTICGRTRQFKNIASQDFALRSHAERQAVNFIVQGSAADLCKMAMILTNEELRKCNPPMEAHLVLQIHDELVWEVKEEQVHAAMVIIKQVMERCGHHCGMPIDLPVSVRIGKNWADMTQQPL